MFEILYMGSEPLTFFVEETISGTSSDPFELVAAIEEQNGKPLARDDAPHIIMFYKKGESDM